MPTLRPKRSHTVIFALAAVCVAAALSGGAAMQQMRQNDLDEQLFTAIQHGSTSELAPLLEQGADPNYIPRSLGDEIGFTALFTSLRHRHIALHVSHGMPMIGCILNGFDHRSPSTALQAKQFKASHILMNEPVFTDPAGKLRALLNHRADPNLLYMGINPLKHAVGMGQSEALRLLLEYGANPDARTTSGDTARTYAKRFNRPAIDALLNAKTAKTK